MASLSNIVRSAGAGVVAMMLATLAPARPALADAAWTVASDWVKNNGSSIRLIGAELKDKDGKAQLVAGIEITLDDGWKTYWRSPGDSGGIPPTFDWDQSTGIAKAQLRYPAPSRYEDPEGVSAGYKHRVVFPIEITAEAGATPELKLGAFYGICREICVPAEAELAFALKPAASADPEVAKGLEDALAAVPRALADGALPSIEKVTATAKGEGDLLSVEARFDPSAKERALFVESSDGAYLPIPSAPEDLGEGRARFEVKLKGQEMAAIRGQTLVLTLVSDKGHAEVKRKAE